MFASTCQRVLAALALAAASPAARAANPQSVSFRLPSPLRGHSRPSRRVPRHAS